MKKQHSLKSMSEKFEPGGLRNDSLALTERIALLTSVNTWESS
jgi:hypothetical protein